MGKQALISVITSTYNRPGLLEASVQSVLQQSYQHFEIVIIDDCSAEKVFKKDYPISLNKITMIEI